ncbi:MAG TPA: sortase [Trebonia sp.]
MTAVSVSSPSDPLAPAPQTPGAPDGPPPYRVPSRPRKTSVEEQLRKGVGSALMVLSACLLVFGLWVTLVSRLHFDRAQHAAYEALRVELALGTAPNAPTDPNDSTKLLALGSPVAVLSIPSIGLRDVVLEGTTGQVLENGPGHLRDTPLPGQEGTSVIMGRRAAYGGTFSRLGSLNPGATITVVTGQAVSSYQVLDLRRAGDPTPPPLSARQGRLVLVTADGAPFTPSGVLYVDADLTTKAQPTPAPVLTSTELPASENAMGTDQGAWLLIVLWGQLLLLATIALSWLRNEWGRWQTWAIAIPVLSYITLSLSDQITRLLPNLM